MGGFNLSSLSHSSVGAATVACATMLSASHPSTHQSLNTDATTYVARPVPASPGRYGFTVIARYTNRRSVPARLEWCGVGPRKPSYDVEAVGPDSAAGAAYEMVASCVGSAPIVVTPGATRVDTLALEGPNRWNGITKRPYGTLTGRFRLVYFVLTASGDRLLPKSLRRSNTFTVHLAQ